MSPVEPNRALRVELEREIENNRRSERRLLIYTGIALLVVAVIAVVRVVFFS